MPLAGKPMLIWSLGVFASIREIDEIVVVVPSRYVSRTRKLAGAESSGGTIKVVAGGGLRQDSVMNGLRSLTEPSGIVLVHDAARPLITVRFVRALLRSARLHSALLPAVPVTDTVKKEGPGGIVAATIAREGLWVAQTPQVFHYDLLLKAHLQARKERFRGTDDASLVERLGVNVHLVPGDPRNRKVTIPADLKEAEMLIRRVK